MPLKPTRPILDALCLRVKHSEKAAKEEGKELEILEKIKKTLDDGKMISQTDLSEKEKAIIKHLNFLTIKAVIYLINSRGTDDELGALKSLPDNTIPLDLKLELECTELSMEELKELKLKSRMDVLIKTCYKILDLINNYSVVHECESKMVLDALATVMHQVEAS